MRKSLQHGFYSSSSVNQDERRFFSRAHAVVERGDVLISGFYYSHPTLLEREQALAGGLKGQAEVSQALGRLTALPV